MSTKMMKTAIINIINITTIAYPVSFSLDNSLHFGQMES